MCHFSLFVEFSEDIDTKLVVLLQAETLQMSFMLFYYIYNHCIGENSHFIGNSIFTYGSVGSEFCYCGGDSGGSCAVI